MSGSDLANPFAIATFAAFAAVSAMAERIGW